MTTIIKKKVKKMKIIINYMKTHKMNINIKLMKLNQIFKKSNKKL